MNIENIKIERLNLIKDNLTEAFNDMVNENLNTKETTKIKKFPNTIMSIFKKIENSYSPDTSIVQEWSGIVKPEEYYNTKLTLIKKNILSGCIRLKRIVKNKSFTPKNWQSMNAILSEMGEQINEFNLEATKQINKFKTNKKGRK